MDVTDHRRSSEHQLVAALREGDALALAEAYHRTVNAGHACARRLVGSAQETEALLLAVYTELWRQPPVQLPPHEIALEAFVRRRCFALGSAYLQERRRAAYAPSVGRLISDLPVSHADHDVAEQVLADLDDATRRALVLAHDQGIPTADQEPGGAQALRHALLALAGPDARGQESQPTACDDVDELGDWILGLLSPARADRVAAEVSDRRACGELARTLRRGRRRLEGLPPTPDMGQRIVAAILASGQVTGTAGPFGGKRQNGEDVEEHFEPAVVAAAEAVVDPEQPPSTLDEPLEPPRPDGDLRLSDVLAEDDDEMQALEAEQQVEPAVEDLPAEETQPDAMHEEPPRLDVPADELAYADELAWDTDQVEDGQSANGQVPPSDTRDAETVEPEPETAPAERSSYFDDQDEPPERSGLSRLVRVVVFLLLLALGSAVGLYVGQYLVG